MPATIPPHLFFWPLGVRRAASGIASVLMQAFMLARARALGSPSPVVQSLAIRDSQAWESELRAREIGVFRRRLEAMEPRRRFRGDPRLPAFEIQITHRVKRSA